MTDHPQNLDVIIFLARKQEYHRAITFSKNDKNLMHPNIIFLQEIPLRKSTLLKEIGKIVSPKLLKL